MKQTFQPKGLRQSTKPFEGERVYLSLFFYHASLCLIYASHKDLCYRNYPVNGHRETLKVYVLNETTGKFQTEWAYALYISLSRFLPAPQAA